MFDSDSGIKQSIKYSAKPASLHKKQERRMGILDLPEEVLLMIFSYVPLYNLVSSVQRTCLAWRNLCFHQSLWREVHYYKEFEERITKEELFFVFKKVSRGVKHVSFERAFHLREDRFSFTKFLQCILHESVDMKNISSLKIPSIPNEYLEPLVKTCSGLSAIEISYEYAYCNDGSFFEAMKELPHLKEFRITESLQYFANFSCHQTKFNELLADMFGGLLELEVVNIDSASRIIDSTLCVLLSQCKNLRELDLYECICITNAGFESLPDKSRITSLHLISACINDEGIEQICRSCPNLRKVSFAGCRDVTDISILHLCTHCPNLESLCVSDPETVYNKSNITDGGLANLFKNYHSLRSLILYNSLNVLNLRVDLLARSSITLVGLDVSGCKSITDDTLRIIAVCCTNLQSVDVSNCVRLRGGGVNLLVTTCKKLHTLKVFKCRFLEDLNFEAFDRKETPFDR